MSADPARATSRRPELTAPKCEQCMRELATVRCDECASNYCATCDTRKHTPERMSKHSRKKLVGDYNNRGGGGASSSIDLEPVIDQLKRQQQRATSAIENAKDLTERREARTKLREIEADLKDKEVQLEKLKRSGGGGDRAKTPSKDDDRRGGGAGGDRDGGREGSAGDVVELEAAVERLIRMLKRAQDAIENAKDLSERREARTKYRELEADLKDKQTQLDKAKRGSGSAGGGGGGRIPTNRDKIDDRRGGGGSDVNRSGDLESAIDQLQRQQQRATSAIENAKGLTERREARTKLREIDADLKDKEVQLEKAKRIGSNSGGVDRDSGRGGTPGRDADRGDRGSIGDVAELEAAVERLTRSAKQAQDAIENAKDLTERREARTKYRELEADLKDKQTQLDKAKRGGSAGGGGGGGRTPTNREKADDRRGGGGSGSTSDLESAIDLLQRQQQRATSAIENAKGLTERREARTKLREIDADLKDKEVQLEKAKRSGGGGDRDGGKDSARRIDGRGSSGDVAELEAAVERLTRMFKKAQDAIENAKDLTERREARTKYRELEADLKDKQTQLDKAKRGGGGGRTPTNRDKADDRRDGGGNADLESAIEQLKRQQQRTTSAIENAKDLTERREARTKLREIEADLKDKEVQLGKLKRSGGDGVSSDRAKTQRKDDDRLGGGDKSPTNRDRDDDRRSGGGGGGRTTTNRDRDGDRRGGGRSGDLESSIEQLKRQQQHATSAVEDAKDLTERREARTKLREIEAELKDKGTQLSKSTSGSGSDLRAARGQYRERDDQRYANRNDRREERREDQREEKHDDRGGEQREERRDNRKDERKDGNRDEGRDVKRDIRRDDKRDTRNDDQRNDRRGDREDRKDETREKRDDERRNDQRGEHKEDRRYEKRENRRDETRVERRDDKKDESKESRRDNRESPRKPSKAVSPRKIEAEREMGHEEAEHREGIEEKLLLHVIRGQDIPRVGRYDRNTFLQIELDGQVHRTTICKEDSNPVWDSRLDIGVVKPDDRLKVTLFDRVGERDEIIGDLRIQVRDLVRKPAAVPLVLEDERGQALPNSDVFVAATLVDINNKKAWRQGMGASRIRRNVARERVDLILHVDKALRWQSRRNRPTYVQIAVGKDSRKTKVVSGDDPVWHERVDMNMVYRDEDVVLSFFEAAEYAEDPPELVGRVYMTVEALLKHQARKTFVLRDRRGEETDRPDLFLWAEDPEGKERMVMLVDKATQVKENDSLVECRVLLPTQDKKNKDEEGGGNDNVEGAWLETQAIYKEGTPKWQEKLNLGLVHPKSKIQIRLRYLSGASAHTLAETTVTASSLRSRDSSKGLQLKDTFGMSVKSVLYISVVPTVPRTDRRVVLNSRTTPKAKKGRHGVSPHFFMAVFRILVRFKKDLIPAARLRLADPEYVHQPKRKPKAASRTCTNCEEREAVVACAECDQLLCRACDRGLHREESTLSDHERLTIEEWAKKQPEEKDERVINADEDPVAARAQRERERRVREREREQEGSDDDMSTKDEDWDLNSEMDEMAGLRPNVRPGRPETKQERRQAIRRLEKDLENMLLKLGLLELYEGVFLEEDVRLDDLLNFSAEEVAELILDEKDRARIAEHLLAYKLAMQKQERALERRAQPISFRSEADLAAAKERDDVKRAANQALTQYLATGHHRQSEISLPERRRYLEHYEREMQLLMTDPDKKVLFNMDGAEGGYPSVPPPTHLDEYGRRRPGSGQVGTPQRQMQTPASARTLAARRVNKQIHEAQKTKRGNKEIVNKGRAPVSSGYGPGNKPARFNIKTYPQVKKPIIQSHPDLKIHDETVSGFTMVYRKGNLRPLFMMSEF